MSASTCTHLHPTGCTIGRTYPRDCAACSAYLPSAPEPRAPSWADCDGCCSLLLDDQEAVCGRQTVPRGEGCERLRVWVG